MDSYLLDVQRDIEEEIRGKEREREGRHIWERVGIKANLHYRRAPTYSPFSFFTLQ